MIGMDAAGLARPRIAGRLDAVHSRHLHVHEDQIEGAFAGGFEARQSILGLGHFRPQALEHGSRHQPIGDIVFHQKDAHAVEQPLFRRHDLDGQGGRRLEHHAEGRALALDAREGDLAAHHARQGVGDGQAEAGPAEPTLGVPLRLTEPFEQMRLRLGADADARILDLQAHPAADLTA